MRLFLTNVCPDIKCIKSYSLTFFGGALLAMFLVSFFHRRVMILSFLLKQIWCKAHMLNAIFRVHYHKKANNILESFLLQLCLSPSGTVLRRPSEFRFSINKLFKCDISSKHFIKPSNVVFVENQEKIPPFDIHVLAFSEAHLFRYH